MLCLCHVQYIKVMDFTYFLKKYIYIGEKKKVKNTQTYKAKTNKTQVNAKIDFANIILPHKFPSFQARTFLYTKNPPYPIIMRIISFSLFPIQLVISKKIKNKQTNKKEKKKNTHALTLGRTPTYLSSETRPLKEKKPNSFLSFP